MDWILKALEREIKRYKTANPFEIASGRNILIRYFPLGETLGFYMRNARHQVITINSDIEEFRKLYTCCHELGHAVLHPDENTPFLNKNTLWSRGKIETQAHYWAVMELLRYHHSKPEDFETKGLMLKEIGLPYEAAKFF